MSLFLSKPLIELESKLDFKELSSVKLQSEHGEIKRKVEVPITDGSCFEGILYTIREFNAAAKTLNYTNGDELFTNFRLCLVGDAKEEWEIVSADKVHTIQGFQQSIHAFQRVFMTNESKANLLDYIQTVMKPKDMDVHTFTRQLQSLNRYAKEMPDDEDLPVLTEAQLKKVVFHAMPNKWQTTFVQANMQLKKCTLMEITEYMEAQRGFADNSNQSRGHKRSFDDHDETNQSNHHRKNTSHRSYHRNKRFRDSQQKSNRHSTDRTKYSNNANCPIHINSNHNWGMCFLNPDGINYRPKREGSNGRPENGKKYGQGVHNNGTHKTDHGHSMRPKTGNYRGPTHQTYFQSDSDRSVTSNSSKTNSVSSDHDSNPQQKNPGVAGRTHANGRAHGRNKNNSRGASLTGYGM